MQHKFADSIYENFRAQSSTNVVIIMMKQISIYIRTNEVYTLLYVAQDSNF